MAWKSRAMRRLSYRPAEAKRSGLPGISQVASSVIKASRPGRWPAVKRAQSSVATRLFRSVVSSVFGFIGWVRLMWLSRHWKG
jgi:hypothetical protein